MNRADFDLLLGILALQNGYIDPPALIAAFHVRSREPDQPLAEILQRRGDLSAASCALAMTLTEAYLHQYGGDPGRGLATLSLDSGTRSALQAIDDDALQASLECLGESSRDDTDPPNSDETLDLPFRSREDEIFGSQERFRVLRLHAIGGLGAVAQALDSELHREVALKQIRPAYADNPECRARFVLEAEITGGLEHPGIVPVYSLGHDTDGRPYYAMRFIQGDSLKQATARFHQAETPDRDPGARTLELQKLLRRFLDVCNAIAYAHSRGVLHRDIKPGNVMVGPFGETLVVDWGLAKLIGTEEGDETGGTATLRPPSAIGGHVTLAGDVVGTPQFMSPEQASGDLDRHGPTSDVYSLGATLYYLLTGRTPFKPDTAIQVISRVLQGEYPPPRQVNPSVPPALEAVCLKAMALRPEDRYQGARALGEEIERWLADEPVLAYPEPWALRARRWTRRHRPFVTATAAAILVGAVGLAATAGLLGVKNREIAGKNLALVDSNRRLDQQRTRAEAGEQQAVAAIQKFRDVVAENPELKEREEFRELRKTLLKEPLAFFQSLRNRLEASGDTRPETLTRLAEAAEELGGLSLEIGNQPDAIQAFQEATSIYQRLSRDLPGQPRHPLGLARSLTGLGTLQIQIGQVEQARASFLSAESTFDAMARDFPNEREIPLGLARARNALGTLDRQEGRLADAIDAFDRAERVLRRLDPDHPHQAIARRLLAVNRISAGELLKQTGPPAEALATLGEARALLEELVRDRPGDEESRAMLAQALRLIGAIQHQTSQSDQAIEAYQTAARLSESLAMAHPSHFAYQEDLAGVAIDLGKLLMEVGRPTEGVAAYQNALKIAEQVASERPEDIEARRRLGLLQFNLGLSQQAAYQSNEAVASWERALAIQEELARVQPTLLRLRADLGATLLNLGTAAMLAGRTADAENALGQSRDLYEELTAAHPDVTAHWIGLAKCQSALATLQGTSDDALAANAQALEIHRRLARDHPEETLIVRDLAASLFSRANLLEKRGRYAEAIAVFGDAIGVLERLVAGGSGITEYRSMLAQCLGRQGALLANSGRAEEALDPFRKCHALYEALARDHPQVLEYQNGLAAALGNAAGLAMMLGRTDEALSASRQALVAFDRLARANPAAVMLRINVATFQENIGELLLRKGQPIEAITSLEQARKTYERMPLAPGNQGRIAQIHCHLGLAHAAAGHREHARSAYQTALQRLDLLLAAQPADPASLALQARCYSELGNLELDTDRPEQARAPLRAAQEILERLAREQPEVLSFQSELALARMRNAGMLRATGATAEALQAFAEVETMLDPIVRSHPNEAAHLDLLARALFQMGQLDRERNQPGSAVGRLTRAASQERKAIASQPENPEYRRFLTDVLLDLARASEAQGLKVEAHSARIEACAWLDQVFPAHPFARD